MILTSLLAILAFASPAMAAFGLQSFEVSATNPTTEPNQIGSPDVQAGSHPDLTTSFVLSPEVPLAEGSLKDARVELPPGFVGDPEATPRCTAYEFTHGKKGPGGAYPCPDDTAVGVESTYVVANGGHEHVLSVSTPVYNVEPSPGVAAELGFKAKQIAPVLLDVSVRTGGDYGVTVNVANINEAAEVYGSTVTIWGVPAEAIHDPYRGECLAPDEREGIQTTYESLREEEEGRGLNPITPADCPADVPVKPFLMNPTSCGVPRTATLSVDSWEDPGSFVSLSSALPELSGCGELDFSPSIGVTPDGTAGSTPTGLNVSVHVPQEATLSPVGLAEADVRDTTVTLPAGLQVNPAAAAGLGACTEADIGFERYDEATGQSFFHEESEQERLGEVAHQECPEASKLGTVKITTPLLSEPLEGAVYQAAQGANPFGSLLALYVVAEDRKAGVRVRLAGKVEPNPQTGQLVSTFDQTPQLPFEEFKLELFGGARAPLATSSCGAYRTESSIEPWSGNAAASPFSEFAVTTGPDGTPCSSLGSFAPAFLSGTANNQAGAFSPFTVTLSRNDGEQTLSTVAMTMPPGLLGMLSSVALCGEAQANAGSCPASSQIGHVTVQAGVGSEPLELPEAGRREDPVYLTGPYGGGPFGLAIVVHPEAGPFNLEEDGRPVIVRARILVNPTTAQVSVASDPMPTILRGIPLDVRTVNVMIDRERFMLNPTSCEPLTVAGTIGSAQGATANVSSRFQAANCAALPFAPKLTASTQGQASKAEGASLDVKIESAGLGQANIHKVDLQLPIALPSRLTTLQKACLEAVFNANPAACDEGSVIGKAIIHTPLLNSPLTGPAYLVSHGGAAFPDVEFVLQGEGITLVLDGKTDIKDGITYSRFESAPDAPFTTFETELPAGPDSILGAYVPEKENYSLCKTSLAMPTTITAQNGAVINQTTNVAVTGCGGVLPSKVVKLTKKQLLAKALKVCKKDKKKNKRVACEKQARKKYGAKAKSKKPAKKST